MKAYLLRILAISLLLAICDFFLPRGKVRRFASPLLGLFITAAVLLPAVSLFRGSAENLEDLLPQTETVLESDTFSKNVEAEYIKRIEAEIEAFGGADATVTLGENYTISHILLTGNPSTQMMFYITTKLEVPRNHVEIR